MVGLGCSRVGRGVEGCRMGECGLDKRGGGFQTGMREDGVAGKEDGMGLVWIS